LLVPKDVAIKRLQRQHQLALAPIKEIAIALKMAKIANAEIALNLAQALQQALADAMIIRIANVLKMAKIASVAIAIKIK